MNPLLELLYKLADDQLIIGHRNSEWTGIGPILEEDIAFASMAQDKVGQSRLLYEMLHGLGEQEPDTLAFLRNDGQFHCCHLVELPIGEYEFSLMRHFLFDYAEFTRFSLLQQSTHAPLALLAQKIRAEIRYHVLHAKTWITRLATSEGEALERLQQALNEAWPLAFSIFEPSPVEEEIIGQGLFVGEAVCREQWLESVRGVLEGTPLVIPQVADVTAHYGGRQGRHTAHLQPLLDEMSEVFRIEPSGEW